MGAQTQINPAGNVKIGGYQHALRLNNAPGPLDELNALPIKTTGNETIFVRDVANVRDGNPPQINVVHVDGQRSVLVNVLKTGATSTLAVVQGVKDMAPNILKILPAAVTGVVDHGRDCLAGRLRRNAQHHDHGRHRARGRYSCR